MTSAPGEAGFAAAKINLHLHVTGRRADGYHELDSLAVFAAVGDRVTALPSDSLSLALDGPFAAGLDAGPGNLVLRAATRLAAAAGILPRVTLRLDKQLPIASGIGGGSADAAATLRLLCSLWSIDPADQAVAAIALGLGADVPVCLTGAPALMRGIGETLGGVPTLPPCGLLLVNPGIAVSTASVFAERAPGASPPCALPAAWPDVDALAGWLAALSNDLQPAALRLCPAIGDALAGIAAVSGCRLTRMSGSGATCYGLFATPAEAAAAARIIVRPGWWAWGGGLLATSPLARGFTTRPSAT